MTGSASASAPHRAVSSASFRPRRLRGSALLAWSLVMALAVATLAAVGVGRGGLLRYAFPAAALGVGLVLYRGQPAFYVGYVWWLWFLSPFVRRLVDYQAGYESLNPVLLAPLLVTGLSLASLFRHLPKLQRRSLTALVPILLSLAYG